MSRPQRPRSRSLNLLRRRLIVRRPDIARRGDPPPWLLPSRLHVSRSTSELIDVDRDYEHNANRDLLPKWRHSRDDETVLQNRGNENSDYGAGDRRPTPKEASSAKNYRTYGLEIVSTVTGNARSGKPGQVQKSGQACQRASKHIDLYEVAIDLDARPSGTFFV